jgi:hypothetical protein
MLMKDEQPDPLSGVLREWAAPEPSTIMDARIRAAHRELYQRSWWRRMWSAEVRMPAPAFAALLLLLIGAVVWVGVRPGAGAPRPTAVSPLDAGYQTRIESAGFQPLPDGAVRVIRSGVQR